MDADQLKDSGKELADKIPDLAFDWYARLIPGFISFGLIEYVYRVDIKILLENFWLVALIAYIIGHLIQPFSSGILQKKFNNLRGKKNPLLSKAYSELIGFFSCFLFCVFFLLFKIIDNILNEIGFIYHTYYTILVVSILFFFLAVASRKKAYDRKYDDQHRSVPKTSRQKKL